MRSIDFSPLLRSSIGFENLNRLMDYTSRLDSSESSYPPYNIEKISEDRYAISMAVAGFKLSELDIIVKEDLLTVSGQAEAEEEERVFLHRGIAKRAFERRFQLADSIKVTNASLDNGLLVIALKREIPEHKKPRQITIEEGEAAASPRVIKGEAA